MAKKYSSLGLTYEAHIFQFGAHGYSLANEECADGSSRNIDPAFSKWHDMSVLWLHKIFGKPRFVDKSTSKMMGYVKEMGL